MISTSELLRAIRAGTIKVQKCLDCHGTGTKFNTKGSGSVCPKCKGRRKLVSIPRDPELLPYDNDWDLYFGE